MAHHLEEFHKTEIMLADELFYFFFVLLNKVHDAFPEVFGDVLGIVFLLAKMLLLNFLATTSLIFLIFVFLR